MQLLRTYPSHHWPYIATAWLLSACTASHLRRSCRFASPRHAMCFRRTVYLSRTSAWVATHFHRMQRPGPNNHPRPFRHVPTHTSEFPVAGTLPCITHSQVSACVLGFTSRFPSESLHGPTALVTSGRGTPRQSNKIYSAR